ncbi:hypothetical protein FB451DRAFT_31624 [Mycena latifolia]|nr:hypothetical protein FB451DRAFT_31624 [Mycena latifolia]
MSPDKDHSVTADSPPAFSPPPSMSTPIKRPTRTYGRPKDPVANQSNPPLQPFKSAWARGSTSHGAGTLDLAQKQSERQHPSRPSSFHDVADGQHSDEEAGDASVGFQFDWRAKMKEIDENLDADDEELASPDAKDALHRAPHPSDTDSSRIILNEDASRTILNSPRLQNSPPVVEDVFGATLSTHTASPEAFEGHSLPPSPPPISNRRRKQRAVVDTSDEDSEPDTKASGRRSPAAPHPITTPKSRSSSTQPTSDDEMPSRIASAPRSKGKGKALASRTQVPALQFNDEPAASHKKRLSETLPAHSKSKFKAPTKKEKQETIRDRGRIAVAQRAAVQPAEPSARFNLQKFFHTVQTSSLARTASSDDPITTFSSSPGGRATSTTVELAEPVPTPFLQTALPASTELRALDESDEENLPEVGELLSGVKEEKTQAEKQQELKARKLLLLAKLQPSVVADDEDDDLEITGPGESKAKDIATERASGSKQKSEGRKRQMALGGISLAQQRAKQHETPPKPLGLASGRRTQDQLAKELAMLVAQKNAEMTKHKEDEWVKRGGRVVEVGGDADDIDALRTAALKEYAEKGQKNAEARETMMQVDLEEDEASDEEWSEARESASPRPQQDSDADVEDADTTMVNEDDDEDEDNDENEAPGQVKSRGARRTRAVIDSDSENDENAPPLQKSASFFLPESILGQEDLDENISPIGLGGAALHCGSVSSMDERTEDEGDKENNTHLMYDRGEDKENKAVPRHPFSTRPVLGRQGSLFGLEEGMQRSLSMSPGENEPMSDGGDDENDAGGDRRRPLQNLLADEDPFLAEPGPSTSVDFTARLQQASPISGLSLDTPESTLQPSFDVGVRVGGKAAGFSQFSDGEPPSFKGAALQPGFSDLFESGTEQQRPPKRPLGLSASFSDKSLFALRQTTVSLGLTQDVDLQPAFEVGDDHLKRQADAIFEKEQEYLWDAASRKAEAKKQELYVNDHGFLTQTRPDVETPEIYTPSSPSQSGSFGTQRSGLLEPQSSLRRPLRTLSLTDSVELDAPERSPLRRLAKRTRTPSPTSNRSSPSPSPAMRTKNAFDMLRREAVGLHAPRPKKPLDKSEFVAEEAQESDDDEMIGFGAKGDDGEEEEGEDMDKTLETLVDDQEMDNETIAAARVLEKFQEQTHEDDLEIEKLHQAAVQGELRKKRRNRGLGMDDSDEEDEEDEQRARKMRRGLAEPKIDNDDVNELAKDPNTRGFYEVYRADLERGDEGEFAYLQETQREATQDAEMAIDEVITQKELAERMREVARQELDEAEPAMDVEDVSWVDGEASDSEGQTKVKTISVRRGTEARNTVESPERKRMHNWAKTEGRSRNAGTGRASGRTAVTGQMAKAKAGGGSLRTGAQAQPGGKPGDGRRPVRSQASVLAVVASDRSARFV